MESAQNEMTEAERGLPRVSRAAGYGTILAISCLASYWIITSILAREYRVSHDNDLVGGMWAVVATIFVFRQSLDRSVKAALSRTLATFLSFGLCFIYLLALPPSVFGMAVLIWISTVILSVAGRSEDAITAAITTAVIFVVAGVSSGPPWLQPIYRLADTAVGISVGLLASRLVPLFNLSPETPLIQG